MFPKKRLVKAFIFAFISCLCTYLLSSSLIVTPKFQSETIIYVPLFVPARQMEQQGIGFASDREIDGHIQILISGRLKDTLSQLFHLYHYYEIDSTSTGAKSELYQLIDERVKIKKTRYSSVSITVEDKSAVRAAKMANALVNLGDIIKENLLATNRKESLKYADEMANRQEKLYNRLIFKRDSLLKIQRTDSNAYNPIAVMNVKEVLDREFQILIQKRTNYRREQENLDSPIPSSYVLTRAIPNHKPAWPPRKLLSIATFLLVFGLVSSWKLLLKGAK